MERGCLWIILTYTRKNERFLEGPAYSIAFLVLGKDALVYL